MNYPVKKNHARFVYYRPHRVMLSGSVMAMIRSTHIGSQPFGPFGEPSAVPSCEEKGSSEASCEPSDGNYYHLKVHLKLQMNLFLHKRLT